MVAFGDGDEPVLLINMYTQHTIPASSARTSTFETCVFDFSAGSWFSSCAHNIPRSVRIEHAACINASNKFIAKMQNIGNFSRLCNKKSARCVFALIFARLLQLTTGDIVFRDDEQSYSLGDNCQFTNGSSGMCFHASACPEAATDWHTLGTPVITCSFIKKEPLVCCFGTRRSSSDLVLSSDRMSQLDDNHETTTVPMQHATDQRISDYRECKAKKSIMMVLIILFNSLTAVCKSKYLRPPNRNDFVVRTSIVGGNRTETGEFPHMVRMDGVQSETFAFYTCSLRCSSHSGRFGLAQQCNDRLALRWHVDQR